MTELKCPFCESIHQSADAFTECVVNCRESQRTKEAAERQASLRKEKEARQKEVIDTCKSLERLVNSYYNDYREYPRLKTTSGLSNFPISKSIWDFLYS